MELDLLKTLDLVDCAVLKRTEAGHFLVLFQSASWCEELFPEIKEGKTRVAVDNKSAYLEDFLIDAEKLWLSGKEGQIGSGIWSEQFATQLLRLEASAVAASGMCYLVVHKITAKYAQKQETLQLARELLLTNDKTQEQHERLNARLDDILSQPEEISQLRPITQALEQTELAVVLLDGDLQLINSNSAFQAVFRDMQISATLPADKLLLQLFKSQYPESARIFSTGSAWSGEICWLNPPKQGKWLKLSVYPIKNLIQDIQSWVLTISDITQVKYLLQRNEKLTHFDVLTDLPNRQYFWQQLEKKIQQNNPFFLIYIDIKQFKRINEIHGHLVGDEIIQALSKRLSSLTRDQDILAKIGGNEFALVMELDNRHTQITEQDQANCARFGQELLKSCSLPFYLKSGQTCEIALNLGAVAFPKDTANAEELMKYADLAVYAAKKQSVSRLEFYCKELVEASRKRIEMEEALQQAIANQEFELYLQPMVDLTSGKIVKAEALLRWRHPSGNIVSPDDFIPLAEQTGLIIPIGNWVIANACSLIVKLQQRGHNIKVSVNLSPRQVNDRHLFDFLKNCLLEANVSPKQIELELTEGVLVDSYDKTRHLLEQVRSLGVTVSIDDFGTGYSSLRYLQRLPIDQIKIDRSFVSELSPQKQESESAIILAVIAIAKSLQMQVIAEGVENVLQRDFLKANGCSIAQGYLFSKPLPFKMFCEYLKAHQPTSD